MLDSAEKSHAGHVRTNNEDSFASVPEFGFFVVADGLGGMAGGERASSLAVQTLVKEAREEGDANTVEKLVKAIELANRCVRWEADNDPYLEGMATTVTAAIIRDAKVEIANAGDSRAYLFSNGKLECLTEDHTWIRDLSNETGRSLESLKDHPLRNMLTKAVGVEAAVGADAFRAEFNLGDILLLCSDGLHGVLPAETISQVLGSEDALDGKAQALLDATLSAGAPDNVTLILVRHAGDGA